MKQPKASPVEAVRTSYPRLADENHQLQQTISGFGKSISGIESSLRRIGLHVSAWHQIAGGQHDGSGYLWSRDIGYTCINNQWHIALREWWQEPGQEDEQTIYKFNEAPPWMCLEAAGKIPELLDELIDRTRDMRAKIAKKQKDVDDLASILAELADDAMKSRR